MRNVETQIPYFVLTDGKISWMWVHFFRNFPNDTSDIPDNWRDHVPIKLGQRTQHSPDHDGFVLELRTYVENIIKC